MTRLIQRQPSHVSNQKHSSYPSRADSNPIWIVRARHLFRFSFVRIQSKQFSGLGLGARKALIAKWHLCTALHFLHLIKHRTTQPALHQHDITVRLLLGVNKDCI